MLYNDGLLIATIVGAILTIAIIVLVVVISVRNAKYRNFVNEHCESIKQLKIINSKYQFISVPNMDMKHSYDNVNMYNDISCADYLIYQLVFKRKQVEKCLDDTYENQSLFKGYRKEYNEKCLGSLKRYDVEELPKNVKKLEKTEQKEILKLLKNPTIEFKITIRLTLTKINGDRVRSKTNTFNSDDIEGFIEDIKQKRGSYYANEYIWNAICRVERGKVSNKMRFTVYERDGWRCRKCGRRSNDLEVDHIYPISKGGKSTFDNLQTLCHRCNVKKGANIEY